MNEITQVLLPRQGDGCDAEELLPLVYNDLRRLAAARMASEAEGQTLQPTALVHEAWMRIFGNGDRRWQNRGHFFGEASEAMRRILIERARRKSRLKHGHGWVRLDIEGLPLAEATPDDKVLLINEALENLKAEDELGLALFQIGQKDEALKELSVGRQSIEDKFNGDLEQGTATQGFWFDWVFARILLREAPK